MSIWNVFVLSNYDIIDIVLMIIKVRLWWCLIFSYFSLTIMRRISFWFPFSVFVGASFLENPRGAKRFLFQMLLSLAERRVMINGIFAIRLPCDYFNFRKFVENNFTRQGSLALGMEISIQKFTNLVNWVFVWILFGKQTALGA